MKGDKAENLRCSLASDQKIVEQEYILRVREAATQARRRMSEMLTRAQAGIPISSLEISHSEIEGLLAVLLETGMNTIRNPDWPANTLSKKM